MCHHLLTKVADAKQEKQGKRQKWERFCSKVGVAPKNFIHKSITETPFNKSWICLWMNYTIYDWLWPGNWRLVVKTWETSSVHFPSIILHIMPSRDICWPCQLLLERNVWKAHLLLQAHALNNQCLWYITKLILKKISLCPPRAQLIIYSRSIRS